MRVCACVCVFHACVRERAAYILVVYILVVHMNTCSACTCIHSDGFACLSHFESHSRSVMASVSDTRRRSRSPRRESGHLGGARRWPWGKYQGERVYYTYNEWQEFVEEEFGESDRSECDALTRSIWDRSIDKDTEDRQHKESKRHNLAQDVGELEVVLFDDIVGKCLATTQVVLELKLTGFWYKPGNSVRVFDSGFVDHLGGAGQLARFTIEFLQREPAPHVRFRSVSKGGYLDVFHPARAT